MSRHIPVTILSYRQPAKLARCLAALEAQRHVISDMYIHRNDDVNLFCSGGFNAGLRRWLDRGIDGAEYHALVTQDCQLAPECLWRLSEFMDDTPRCGIAGIKQIAEDGDTIIHGGCTQAFPNGIHIGGSKAAGNCSESALMPWVNGSVMMLRRRCIQDIGLFDENMKLVGIESDLCYRARVANWQVWYCAEAECTHEAGGVSGNPSPELVTIFQDDMLHWGNKWMSFDGKQWTWSGSGTRLMLEFQSTRISVGTPTMKATGL